MMQYLSTISIRGLIMGFFASQGASWGFGILVLILSFFVHGGSAFAGVFEYFLPVTLISLLGLLAYFIGGYVAVQFDKKSLVTALTLGLFNLMLSVWFFSLLDFKYGGDYAWIANGSLLFIIPASYLGGKWFFRRLDKIDG